MKPTIGVFIFSIIIAAPVFAQQNPPVQQQVQETRGYVTAVAGLSVFSNISGFSTAGKQATSDIGANLGVRVRPHILVVGEGGWLRNLQKGVQPMLVNTTTSLYDSHAISLTGGGSLGVWYGLGGVGVTGPTVSAWTPYIVGAIGVARLIPSLQFTYNSGTIPGKTTAPATGSDVTAALGTAGFFKAPPSSNSRMATLSAGVQRAFSSHLVADGQYRYSQIAANTDLASKAVSTNAIAVGLGVRF
jgi:opacity protein-like surface antigen